MNAKKTSDCVRLFPEYRESSFKLCLPSRFDRLYKFVDTGRTVHDQGPLAIVLSLHRHSIHLDGVV